MYLIKIIDEFSLRGSKLQCLRGAGNFTEKELNNWVAYRLARKWGIFDEAYAMFSLFCYKIHCFHFEEENRILADGVEIGNFLICTLRY